MPERFERGLKQIQGTTGKFAGTTKLFQGTLKGFERTLKQFWRTAQLFSRASQLFHKASKLFSRTLKELTNPCQLFRNNLELLPTNQKLLGSWCNLPVGFLVLLVSNRKQMRKVLYLFAGVVIAFQANAQWQLDAFAGAGWSMITYQPEQIREELTDQFWQPSFGGGVRLVQPVNYHGSFSVAFKVFQVNGMYRHDVYFGDTLNWRTDTEVNLTRLALPLMYQFKVKTVAIGVGIELGYSANARVTYKEWSRWGYSETYRAMEHPLSGTRFDAGVVTGLSWKFWGEAKVFASYYYGLTSLQINYSMHEHYVHQGIIGLSYPIL